MRERTWPKANSNFWGKVFCKFKKIFLPVTLSLLLALEPILFISQPSLALAEESILGKSESSLPLSQPVEIIEKRTENSKHFLMPDGSYKAEIYASPIHYKDEEGKWKEFRNNLIPLQEEVGYQNEKGPLKIKLKPEKPKTFPVSISSPLDPDWEVKFDLMAAREDYLFSFNNKVYYLLPLPDTDLIYEVIDNGLKETLVLNSVQSPSSFTFYLKTRGLELRSLEKGGYGLFKPGQQNATLYLGGLSVYDSSCTASGEPVYCQDATYTVSPAENGYLITYSIPEKWLRDPSRVYPVYLDPSVTKIANQDTYVSSAYPSTSYGSSTELKVGYYNSSTGHNRSFVKFDLSSLAGAYIKQATFSAYMFHQYYISDPTVTYLAKLTSSWSESTTWNSRPSYSYLASQSVSGRGVWVNWELTGLVRNWISGSEPNYGVMMYQKEDGSENTTHWKKFYSSEYSDTSYRPKLVVYYDYPDFSVSYSTPPYIADDMTTVSVSVRVDTPYSDDIREIRLLPNYTSGDPSRYGGYFAWFSYDPGSSWVKRAVSPGYFAYYPSGYNINKVTPLLNECTLTNGSGYKIATFKFRYKPNWGDIQDNDFDYYIGMGTSSTVWTSGWKNYNSNCDVLPKPVTNFTTTSLEALGWWKEVDRDGDGKGDTPNDFPNVGRGRVNLNWEGSGATANGYTIYLFDGYAYRQVGKVFGSTNTSWSTKASRAYPGDSEIASFTVGTTSNPFYRGSSPSAESKETTITITGLSGAGVALTDGTYLYVRRWGGYPGPLAWTKIGTGLNGTAKGKVYGTVGKNYTSAETIFSGFYLNGFLYSGRTVTTDGKTIEGVWKGEPAGSTNVRLFTFDQPLLERGTGNNAGSTGSLLLTSDGEKIYSVAYSLGTGSYDGFRIRVFKVVSPTSAQCLGTYDIPMESYYVDGVLADGEALYLIEWKNNNAARISKVRLSDYKVINQWTIDQGDSRAINGCFDPANNLFWLGALDTGKVYRYAGPGFDLRDNPQPLYQKMGDTNYDNNVNYWFRVVPFNSAGSPSIWKCAAFRPTLDKRTIGVNDDPRHAFYELSPLANHEASILLDKGALSLSATDLSIDSWGPKAQVSRTYNSASEESNRFASGWHFNFDSCLKISTSTITYLDEKGEEHIFTSTQNGYFAPLGFYADLTQTPSGYRLSFKDRSYLNFDLSGKLLSRTDKNGNQVSYVWKENSLTIKAPNDQEIIVTFSPEGKILSATYSTSSGLRRVDYSMDDNTSSVRFYPQTTDEFSHVYTYTNGKLTGLDIPEFEATEAPSAHWEFVYNNNKLSEVRLPGYSSNFRKRLEVAYNGLSATVTRYGKVNGVDEAISQTFTLNPNGTVASRTNPKISSETTATWTYSYSPTNEEILERSPLGKERKRIYDIRGNLLYEWDEEGHRTAYFYDQYDQLIREISPRGSSTYYTYDSRGNLIAEEKELTAGGSCSRTEYTYDTLGRLIKERRKIDSSKWQETQYSDFAPSGEAQTITQVGVKLSTTATPVNLVSKKIYNDFGELLLEIDPTETTTTQSTYSISGRLLSSTNAYGVTTHYRYDVLGNEIESYKENTEGKKIDLLRKVFDPEGKELIEKQLYTNESIHKTITTTYDEMGREIQKVDSIEGTTTMKYDARGNMIYELKAGEKNPTTIEYDAEGNEIKRIDPDNQVSGKATFSYYYPSGLLKKEVNPDNSWTEYRYDEEGNKTEEISPTEEGETVSTQYFYDLGGRLVKEISPDEMITSYTYDLLGNQLSSRSEGTTPTTNLYNSLGWVLNTLQPDGERVEKVYDKAGRVVSEVRSGGLNSGITTYTYDQSGNLRIQENPDGTRVEYTYDSFGRTIREKHLKNESLVKDIETKYDELNRITETYDHRTDIFSTYTYATGSNKKSRVTISYSEATTTLTYDATEKELTRKVAREGLSIETTATSRTPSGLLLNQTLRVNSFSLPSFSFTYNLNWAARKPKWSRIFFPC